MLDLSPNSAPCLRSTLWPHLLTRHRAVPGDSPHAPTPGPGFGPHSLIVIEAVLGSQIGADRRQVLGAFADDPGFTVKADLPRRGGLGLSMATQGGHTGSLQVRP